MKVTKIICDRCGDTIEEPHPDRLQVAQYTKRYGGTYKEYKSYVVQRKLHLCKECEKEFNEFLKERK